MKALKKALVLFLVVLLLTNVWVPSSSYAAGEGDDYIFTMAGNGSGFQWVGDNVDKRSQLKWPGDVVVDRNGNIYVVELGYHRIRKIDVSTGQIKTVAGAYQSGNTPVDGTQLATSVGLMNPQSIVVDASGNLYIGDSNRILKVDTDLKTSQLWTGGVRGMALDSNGVLHFVQNTGLDETNTYFTSRVLKLVGETVCVVAGMSSDTTTPCVEDSDAILVEMSSEGIAFDSDDNLYIAESGHHIIRKVDPSGTTTIVAGQSGQSGNNGDGGLATDALLNTPNRILLHSSGNLYFSDYANHVIRKVDLATNVISTVAGGGNNSSAGDNGLALASLVSLQYPKGLAEQSDGTILIGEGNQNRVRAIKKGYKLTYNGNANTAGSVPTESIVDPDVISLSNQGDLVKQGYTFNGWNTQADGSGTNYLAGSNYTVTGNVTLYAEWQMNQYTLSYTAGQNGTINGQPSLTQSVYHGLSGTVVTAIPNTGYEFDKWDDNDTNATRTDENVQGPISVTASFKVADFDVSFESNGAGTIPNQNIEYNGTATKPEDPVRTGYTFDNWYSDITLTTPFDFATPITGDTHLYAKWAINLSYTAGPNGTIDGQPSVTQSVYQGMSGTAVTAIPNIGYMFDKWSDNNTNATRTDENVQGPISVTANFAKEENIVSFESNGAGTIPSQNIAYPGTVTKPEDPVRTGYTFNGWYSDVILTTPFDFATPITGDTYLYAKWGINLSYTAGLNGTIDGQPSVTQSVYQGMSGTAVTAIPNTGYVFEKWSDNNTNATRTDEDVQGPISVTASFIKEVYTVSFNSNGGTAVSSQDVRYNEYALQPVTIPTLNGYSFVEWYSDSDLTNRFNFINTPITGNTTLYAKWIILPPGATVIQTVVAGDSTITITWSDVDTAIQYKVFQSTTSGSYGDTPIISVSDSVYSYQVTGLTNGNTYYFVVSAVNAGGDGVTSVEVSATPRTVPLAPTNVTAVAGDRSATINFTLPANNGGSPITGYHVVWSSGSLTVTETSTPITVTGLTNGTPYTFTVQAINSVGNSADSTASNEVTPAAPTYDGGSTVVIPTEPIKSTNGQITVPTGQAGEASLNDEVVLVIPVGSSEEALSITIEKLVDTANIVNSGEVFVSPVFELLKNITDNFMKPVTLTFKFDRSKVEEGQRVAIFYYDEVNLNWVEVGGQVEGDSISAEVDHFTKFAVLIVNEAKPETIETHSFSDITNHWAEANIKKAVQQGIVNGYPDGTFKPNATITRSEFMVMLMNALKPVGKAAELNFTDMSAIGAWARQSIEQAVGAGILTGNSDGSFRPNAEITRAELAVIIARALGVDLTSSADITDFLDDSQIPAWAKVAVAAVKDLGIMNGRNGNLFVPGDTATRAEAITVIMKLLQIK